MGILVRDSRFIKRERQSRTGVLSENSDSR